MTQKHIRKAAGWGPLRRAWARLHEPEVISAIYGGWWLFALGLGGFSVVNPPRSIETVTGDVLMSIIAGIITVGGIIGVAAVPRGAYWAERPAVACVAIGMSFYGLFVAYLWWDGTGNRGMQELGIIGSVAFTLLRLHWVMDRPYSKRRGARNRAAKEAQETGETNA